VQKLIALGVSFFASLLISPSYLFYHGNGWALKIILPEVSCVRNTLESHQTQTLKCRNKFDGQNDFSNLCVQNVTS